MAVRLITILRAEKSHGLVKLLKSYVNPVAIYHNFKKPKYCLAVPFKFDLTCKVERVAIIAHLYYTDYDEEIFQLLKNIPVPADLFISTDCMEKKQRLSNDFSKYSNGNVDIRVFENRGRDIAPKLIGFRDVYENYDYFLHIHSKRSPHGKGRFDDWRSYLFANLLGSREIVESILSLLSLPEVGIVFPEHAVEVRNYINWGNDFESVQQLLSKSGVELKRDRMLEFPSGSMFWGKSQALRELLKLDLQFSQFEEEASQVDGTLAHAIERSYLFFAEAAGYIWIKILRDDLAQKKDCLLEIDDLSEVEKNLDKVYKPLIESNFVC